MSDDLITLRQAAELIGKNLRTIQRYIKSGRLITHKQNGKHLLSRNDVETKFNVVKTQKPAPVAEKPVESRQATLPRQNDNDTFWREEAFKYQTNWTKEIEKHSETKESLGEWRGRAEAYQAFASRLLGDGKMPEIQPDNKKDDLVATDVSISSSKKNSTLSPLLLYIIMAILLLALILVIFFYRIKLGLL